MRAMSCRVDTAMVQVCRLKSASCRLRVFARGDGRFLNGIGKPDTCRYRCVMFAMFTASLPLSPGNKQASHVGAHNFVGGHWNSVPLPLFFPKIYPRHQTMMSTPPYL